MKKIGFLILVVVLLLGCIGEEGSIPTDTPTETPPETSIEIPPATPTEPPPETPPVIDDGMIAFTSGRDGNAEIYIMNGDGSDQRRLTDNPAYDAWPSWSPDGLHIAFTSTRNGNDGADIYVMDADGGNVRQLTYHSAGDFWPDWSPDGKRIAFVSSRDGNLEIYVINVDGTNLQRLTNTPSAEDFPTWSPDSSQIVFSRIEGNDGTFIINADGSNERKLADFKVLEPAWSPDGKQIAFGSDHEGFRGIYVMDADGGNVQRLSRTHAGENCPEWSPDGKRIVFASWRDGDGEIYVMDADGGNVQKLTDNSFEEEFPAWRPAVTSQTVSPTYKFAFGIDYAHPKQYVVQGEQSRISNPEMLDQLRSAERSLAHLGEIYRWLKNEFTAYSAGGETIGVVTVDQLLEERRLGGCHDQGLVYAAVVRELGYPAIMVRTASIAWIEQFQEDEEKAKLHIGHVFVEVYVDDTWVLIDSTNGWYVEDGYDPADAGIPLRGNVAGSSNEIYGFYVECKGIDTWAFGIHSPAESIQAMDELARKLNLESIVYPDYTFRQFAR